MLEPSISVIQAIIAAGIVALATFLTIALFKSNPKNRYPSKWAGLFCLTFVIWMIVNIFGDRTTDITLYTWLGRLTYAIPYWVFVFFLGFVGKFPPSWKNKNVQILTWGTALIALFMGVIHLLPSGLVLYFDTTTNQMATRTDAPYFYFSHVIYLALLSICTASILVKRKKMMHVDKLPMRIIGAAFVTTVVSSIAMSVFAAFNVFDFYAYYYSYLSVGIFFILFAYVILRFGVISTPLSFSRKTLLSSLIGFTILLSLGLLGLGLINLLGTDVDQALSLPQAILGIAVGFAIQQSFERLWNRKSIQSTPKQSSASQISFLQQIKERYQLTGIAWMNKAANQSVTALGTISPTAFTARLLKMPSILGIANPIDVPKKSISEQHFGTLQDAGPQRISLVLPATDGYYLFGHKRFNIAFSEDEILDLKREISLRAAEQEIERLRLARTNHIAEIESVTEKGKKRLAEANELIYRKLQRRATFFRTIARELRTPLTVVSSLVQGNEIALPNDARRTIDASIAKLVTLSKEFELTSGLEIVDEPLTAWIDLQELAEQVAEQFSLKAKNKNIRVETSATTDAAISIKKLHLDQILDNLLSNAINYSPEGSTITCDLIASPGRLKISVSDEGPGIPQEELQLIFEPFYRATTSKNTKGTGLGLSTVKKLSNLYKGACTVETLQPTGSLFVVDIAVRTKLRA